MERIKKKKEKAVGLMHKMPVAMMMAMEMRNMSDAFLHAIKLAISELQSEPSLDVPAVKIRKCFF